MCEEKGCCKRLISEVALQKWPLAMVQYEELKSLQEM